MSLSKREKLFVWALLASHLPFARTALNREAFITLPAMLPRQADSCSATATPCPDGLGCCPSGYPCDYSSQIPVCDKPCDPLSVYCTQGGCCDPGSSCLNADGGLCGPTPSVAIISPTATATTTNAPLTAMPTPSGATTPTPTSSSTTSSLATTVPSTTSSSTTTSAAQSNTSTSGGTMTSASASSFTKSSPTTSLPTQQSTAGAAPFNQLWSLGKFDIAIVGIIGFLGL